MAKKLEDLITRITKFEQELRNQMPTISKEMAGVALSYSLAIIRKDGLPGRPQYSNRKVPAYLYRGKNRTYPNALNGAGRTFIDQKIKEMEKARAVKKKGFKGYSPFGASSAGMMNWKMLRKAQGLQTTEVDFTYTGRTLQNVGPIAYRTNFQIYVTVLGGTQKETKNKLKWGMKRYGRFLDPNQKAQDMARRQGLSRIGDLFKSVVLTP